MKNLGWRKKISRLSCALFVLLPASAGAVPTTAEQAERVVRHWLALDQRPLGAELGSAVSGVETYKDQDGHPLYYVVNLSPKGFVIISGDTEVEPVIAFAPQGKYDPSEAKPLGALVSRDLPGRVHTARASQAAGKIAAMPQKAANGGGSMNAPQKWEWLGQNTSATLPMQAASLSAISDVRVAPLLQSKWNQEGIYDSSWQYINLYNLYTPNNYVSGCVATAMSQVMRYFSYPIIGVGSGSYTVKVGLFLNENSLVPITTNLRGGNGSGGAYNWSSMPYVPDGNTINVTQKDAIGYLLHDAGASVCMKYSYHDGSSSSLLVAGKSMMDIFKYSNTKNGANYDYNLNRWENISGIDRVIMTNPNLDAGYPVLYGINNDAKTAGHAVVCDGYGYNASSMYHHLNMGWGGEEDAWYNLPIIDTNSSYYASSINEIIYNIYPSGSGEIISGRITDSSGNPLSGVNITAARMGGGFYSTVTNDKGIYALAKIPSSSNYTVSPLKGGYAFQSQTVSTGISVNAFNADTDPCINQGYLDAGTVGNYWGLNFTALSNAPEIDVRGNGSSIPSGDASPSKSDHTDFGATPIGTQVSRTYTIANTGGVPLSVSAPILTGLSCNNFMLTESPAASVTTGGTTTFTIRYLPTFSGDSGTCTVNITNSDSDESPYTFTIKGAEGIEKIPGWLPAVYDLLM